MKNSFLVNDLQRDILSLSFSLHPVISCKSNVLVGNTIGVRSPHILYFIHPSESEIPQHMNMPTSKYIKYKDVPIRVQAGDRVDEEQDCDLLHIYTEWGGGE